MIDFLVKPAQELASFVCWWIWLVPKSIIIRAYDFVLSLDEILVLGETFRLWLAIEPLFGDYGWQGRLVGFLFRTLRLILSVLIYVAVVPVGLGLLMLWWALPIIAVALIFNLLPW